MRSFFSFFILLCFFFCRPTAAWAYRATPLIAITSVLHAAHASDITNLQASLGRSALCLWGTSEGIALIQEQFPSERRSLRFDILAKHSEYMRRARFVGFWSYYLQTHLIRILDQRSLTLLAEGEIECNFGMGGSRRERDLQRPVADYQIKDCKLVLLEARSFAHPTAPEACSLFRQSLND